MQIERDSSHATPPILVETSPICARDGFLDRDRDRPGGARLLVYRNRLDPHLDAMTKTLR